MVVQGSKPDQKLIYLKPESLSDLNVDKMNSSDRFILIFSLIRCPPCNALNKWLESGGFVPVKDTTVYQVKADDPKQSKVFSELRERLSESFSSVPYIVAMDKNFNVLGSITGFDKKGFMTFCETHIK